MLVEIAALQKYTCIFRQLAENGFCFATIVSVVGRRTTRGKRISSLICASNLIIIFLTINVQMRTKEHVLLDAVQLAENGFQFNNYFCYY